ERATRWRETAAARGREIDRTDRWESRRSRRVRDSHCTRRTCALDRRAWYTTHARRGPAGDGEGLRVGEAAARRWVDGSDREAAEGRDVACQDRRGQLCGADKGRRARRAGELDIRPVHEGCAVHSQREVGRAARNARRRNAGRRWDAVVDGERRT